MTAAKPSNEHRANKTSNLGFWSLVLSQFFGAANDNILKFVLVFGVLYGVWSGELGEGAAAQSYINYLFTIPFILLSGFAGTFSDRNSKSRVVLWVKIAEIPIAILAAIGFWMQDLWITMTALLALTCQSSFFGPAKYGMIPELVADRDLSRANGLINMMTNIAVIAGTLIAGQVATYYSPRDPNVAPVLWLPGLVLVTVSILGTVSACFLPKLHPGDKKIKYQWNPFETYYTSLKEIVGRPLFTVMFCWAFFYFLAGLALAILSEYATVLNIDQGEASVLLGILGLAIGAGCVLAGFISGDSICPRLVPIGGFLMSLFFLLLGVVPSFVPDLPPYLRVLASPVSWFLLGVGISAGFFIVPLQALLQHLTPDNELGRYLGTANGLSFAFLLASAIFYQIFRPIFTFPDGTDRPEWLFAAASLIMLAGVLFFLWRIKSRGYTLDRVVTDLPKDST